MTLPDAGLAALETAFLAAGPDDQPDVTAHLAPPVGNQADGEYPLDDMPEPPAMLDPAQFHEQMFMVLHIVGSGIASARTGREVDLVSVAKSDQGQIASGAMYRILDRYDFARRWFLTPGSSAMMDFAMVVVYGQALAGAIRNAPFPVTE